MEKEVTLPEGVEAKLDGKELVIKGPKGELRRAFSHPKTNLDIKGSTITVKSTEDRRKANAVVGAWAAHIRNMSKGVVTEWEARLKSVHSHFPIKVNVEGDKVVIQNFLGERRSRLAKVPKGVKVEVKKDEIIVTGMDKELVGQACGNIETVTKVTKRDKRIFQDGIYILGKPKPSEGGKK